MRMARTNPGTSPVRAHQYCQVPGPMPTSGAVALASNVEAHQLVAAIAARAREPVGRGVVRWTAGLLELLPRSASLPGTSSAIAAISAIAAAVAKALKLRPSARSEVGAQTTPADITIAACSKPVATHTTTVAASISLPWLDASAPPKPSARASRCSRGSDQDGRSDGADKRRRQQREGPRVESKGVTKATAGSIGPPREIV